jgi:ABC-type ATPase involved in cell division
MFIFHIWRRFARYGFDDTQSSAAHQWTFYLFNGATYERGQWERIAIRAEKQVLSVLMQLFDAPSLRTRAKSAFARCQSSDYIARALANGPAVLLADEPTGNLDPQTSAQVFQSLLGVVRTEGAAALIATHNLELTRFMDRVVSLENGRLVEQRR